MTITPLTINDVARIEAAAGHAANNERPRCRCGGTCERCAMSQPGKSAEPLAVREFKRRVYNQPWKHEGERS